VDHQTPPQTIPVGYGRSLRRIAVLCPGPSLLTFKELDAYDVRIGVNRAAEAVRCDYWVALDVHTAGITLPQGQPVVVNTPDTHSQMCSEFPYVSRLGHMSLASLRLDCSKREPINWRRFGLTVAMVLGAQLGADRVDCFGVDWHGQADFDGSRHIRNRRSESRWQREQRLWCQVAGAMLELGIHVRRITAAHAGCQSKLQL
jgi:hypothetical protein